MIPWINPCAFAVVGKLLTMHVHIFHSKRIVTTRSRKLSLLHWKEHVLVQRPGYESSRIREYELEYWYQTRSIPWKQGTLSVLIILSISPLRWNYLPTIDLIRKHVFSSRRLSWNIMIGERELLDLLLSGCAIRISSTAFCHHSFRSTLRRDFVGEETGFRIRLMGSEKVQL